MYKNFTFMQLIMVITFAFIGQSAASEACRMDGSMVSMENCQRQQLDDANRRLNTEYQAKMLRLSPERQARLRVEERSWMADRDAKCKVLTDQGTSGVLDAGTCLLRETTARLKQIKKLS